MATDFTTQQRDRVRWKLRTKRGLTQEAAVRENRALMRDMVHIQTAIKTWVQVLADIAVTRGVGGGTKCD